jgi:hypothetical protein
MVQLRIQPVNEPPGKAAGPGKACKQLETLYWVVDTGMENLATIRIERSSLRCVAHCTSGQSPESSLVSGEQSSFYVSLVDLSGKPFQVNAPLTIRAHSDTAGFPDGNQAGRTISPGSSIAQFQIKPGWLPTKGVMSLEIPLNSAPGKEQFALIAYLDYEASWPWYARLPLCVAGGIFYAVLAAFVVGRTRRTGLRQELASNGYDRLWAAIAAGVVGFLLNTIGFLQFKVLSNDQIGTFVLGMSMAALGLEAILSKLPRPTQPTTPHPQSPPPKRKGTGSAAVKGNSKPPKKS